MRKTLKKAPLGYNHIRFFIISGRFLYKNSHFQNDKNLTANHLNKNKPLKILIFAQKLTPNPLNFDNCQFKN